MASLAATNWHKPLSLIPCLSWSTASSVFTQVHDLTAISNYMKGCKNRILNLMIFKVFVSSSTGRYPNINLILL